MPGTEAEITVAPRLCESREHAARTSADATINATVRKVIVQSLGAALADAWRRQHEGVRSESPTTVAAARAL